MSEPQVVSNPSPKSRFRYSADTVKRHREIVSSGNFIHAVDVALLEYAHRLLMSSRDGNTAAQNQFKLAGAYEIIHLFKTLGEEERMPQQPKPNDNLENDQSVKIASLKQ